MLVRIDWSYNTQSILAKREREREIKTCKDLKIYTNFPPVPKNRKDWGLGPGIGFSLFNVDGLENG